MESWAAKNVIATWKWSLPSDLVPVATAVNKSTAWSVRILPLSLAPWLAGWPIDWRPEVICSLGSVTIQPTLLLCNWGIPAPHFASGIRSIRCHVKGWAHISNTQGLRANQAEPPVSASSHSLDGEAAGQETQGSPRHPLGQTGLERYSALSVVIHLGARPSRHPDRGRRVVLNSQNKARKKNQNR